MLFNWRRYEFLSKAIQLNRDELDRGKSQESEVDSHKRHQCSLLELEMIKKIVDLQSITVVCGFRCDREGVNLQG